MVAGTSSLGGAEAALATMGSVGILAGVVSRDEIRLVTHRHVTPPDVETALARLRTVTEQPPAGAPLD